MAAMAANSSTVHNVRSNRAGNMGPPSMTGDRSRAGHASMGKGFGGNSSWNASNIWGGAFDEQQGADTKSGSSSLLPSSDSDGWNKRPNIPWSTLAKTSGMTTSPVQSRAPDRSAPTMSDGGDTTSYFSVAPRSSQTGASHNAYMNSGPEGISPSGEGIFAGFRNGEPRRHVSTSGFGGSPVGAGFSAKSGFSSPLESTRGEEVSGSVGMAPLPQTLPESIPQQLSRNAYAHTSHNSASFAPQRPVHSSYPSFHSESQFEGRYGNGSVDLNSNLAKLQLNEGSYQSHPGVNRPAFLSQSSFDGSVHRMKYQNANDANYQNVAGYTNDVVPSELPLGYQTSRGRIGESGPISPTDYPRVDSPSFYSPLSNGSVHGPHYRNPTTGHIAEGQGMGLDRKIRGSLPDAEYAAAQADPLQRLQFAPNYDIASIQAARLSALSGLYAPIQIGAAAFVSRGQRDHDPAVARGPVLEEFRQNNKGNKKYDLKDIYGHVVEFSGDQHGSRFIQQKLETANSDEKERVFQEIQPNSLQLMTDVFGNYVVQKLFEHGNQTQKKILANQMKGHIMSLSNQMYGCRVVQKALEHILTDQQASMVRELDANIAKCVKDQNGNHVIQKAIERVPSEYLQAIISEFRGKVDKYAMHPYGCRVIQRMLEHCEESDRQSILAELHASTHKLIPDQYGNYVIQHVIENGAERDRSAMISVVMSNLLSHSKHKFASNVVEKSIEYGSESQRQNIIQMLTCAPDGDDGHLLGLMRDQYGNYVIQKVLGVLKGSEREALVEKIKPLLGQLKKISYGKQIVAIEKLIGESPSTSTSSLPSQTDTSTTPPNSHKSSPQPPKRSVNAIDNCRAPLVGAAPPTPPPTDNPNNSVGPTESKNIAKTTITPLVESESTGPVSHRPVGVDGTV